MTGASLARRLVALAMVGVMTTVLSGCTPEYDVSLRLLDQAVEFAPCQSVTFNSIYVYAELKNSDDDAVLMWQSSGVASNLSAGDAIEYGSPPDGFSNVLPPADLVIKGYVISVYFENAVGGDVQSDVYGSFDGDELKSDTWLNSKRGQTASACEE